MCFELRRTGIIVGIFAVLMFALVSILVPGASANEKVKITVDDVEVVIPPGDQPAFIQEARTYVPIRVVGEHLGAEVEWQGESKTVLITTPGAEVSALTQGTVKDKGIHIFVDGRKLGTEMGEAFITERGRTVIPLRAVGEALNCIVEWDAESRKVVITTDSSALLHNLASYRTNLRLLDLSFINSAELYGKREDDFSEKQIESFKAILRQLQAYNKSFTLPDGRSMATSELSIKGPAIATAEQLRSWVKAEEPRLRQKVEREMGREFQPIPDLADLYLRIGEEYGIRGDLAFAQAAKETHYWQYTGLVQPDQNNYCGLWATGTALTGDENLNGADSSRVVLEPGRHGATFTSPEAGVEAHIQHLYAYASTEPLPQGKELLSPRFALVQRGCAPTWQGLNARWAVPGTTYGQSIIHDYWLPSLKY